MSTDSIAPAEEQLQLPLEAETTEVPPSVLTPNTAEPTSAWALPEFNEELSKSTETLVNQFKKGWRTTEFWLTLGAVGLVIAGDKFGLDLTTEQVWGVVSIIGLYAGNRGWLKVNRVKALK